MTATEFDVILNDRINKMRVVLGTKAGEYATDDRLHNFKSAALQFGEPPTAVCWYYMLKHLMSIKDLATGVKPATPATIDEKIGDAVNYLVLMEALFREAAR